jgi:hypothetical protein
MLDVKLTGVWLADSPLDGNEGTKGGQVLRVEFPPDVDLDDYELIEELKPYREWCVPAALINELATVTLIGQAMLPPDCTDVIHRDTAC